MESHINAFLRWRQGTTFGKESPLDPEDLKDVPECVLRYTETIESLTWTKIDPEPGYWMIENYLSNRRRKQHASPNATTLADPAAALTNQSEKYADSRNYYYHQKYGYATDGSATARPENDRPTAMTQGDGDEDVPATFTPSLDDDLTSPPQNSRSSQGNTTLSLTLHTPVSTAPQASSSHPTAQNPRRSASKAHFHELETKGIWQRGDTLRVPLYQDQDRKIQQGIGLLRYVGRTANSRWASDWDLSINNGPVSRVIGMNGPTEFIEAFDNRGVIGPKGAWSSRVRVVRGNQDLGTVTEFKAMNSVDAAVGSRGS